jgi:Fic family protein
MWTWQQTNWPHFDWDKAVVEPLVRQTRLNQGILLGKMFSHSQDEKESLLDTLLANIVHSSAIEGE